MLAGAFLMVQLIAPLSATGLASATQPADPPGNNGTLKVHEKGTPSGTENNDPKVCAFNFEGFGFDVGQDGYIQIDGQGQTTGTYGDYAFGPTVADPQHTSYAETQYFNDGGVTIPDGHYKATLYGKDTGQNIDLKDEKAKSKVFKVECTPPEPKGLIKIEKDAIPDSTQPFTFMTQGLSTDNSGFTLTDTSAAGLPSKSFEKLPAGTYKVRESYTQGWRLTDITCSRGAEVSESLEDASVTIYLSEGEHVRCTFENRPKEVREKPTLSLVKKVNGGDAKPTDWKLWAIPPNEQYQVSGYGGFEPTEVAANIVYTLKETGGLDGYTAGAWKCDGGSQDGNTIKLASGNNVTCTITNTRDTGTVTVNKVVKSENDRGLFNLQINGETYAENVGNGGTTGAQTVPTGEYVVSEAAGMYTNMNHYMSSYKCYDGEQKVAYGFGTMSSKFVVEAGHNVVCTFYNVRKPEYKPATITVVKNLDLNGDGKVDVRDTNKWTWTYGNKQHEDIQSQVYKTGSHNPVTVKPGKYTVTEGQREGYHVTQSACYVKGQHEGDDHEESLVQGLGSNHEDRASTSEHVWLKPGDHAICVFTNTRDTAKVKVVKHLAPSDDNGLFNLWVNGHVVRYAASNGDSSHWTTVPTGHVQVAESASHKSETNLSDYRSSYVCYEWNKGIFDDNHNWPPRQDGGDQERVLGLFSEAKQQHEYEHQEGHKPKIVARGYSTWVKDLRVSKNDHVTCVFTNVRKPSITIVKDAQPDSTQAFDFQTNASHHDKYFTLVDDGTGDGTGEGNSKTFSHIYSGKYYTFQEKDMSQLNWMLDSISCEGSDGWKVTEDHMLVVQPKMGEQVVCTFVNVKKAEVTIVKDATTDSPSAFNFSTNLTGDTSLFSLVDNGKDPELASKSFMVQPGTYTVEEKSLAGWNLSKINCSEGATVEWSGTGLQITVAAGDDITCTFVNDPTGGSGGQVLGASTTVSQGPTLVNTGNNALINLIAGLMFIIMAIGARWFGRTQTSVI